MASFSVILPAAGSGSRFGSDKLDVTLSDGRTVLQHAIDAFARRADVAVVVVVGPRKRADVVASLDVEPGRVTWCEGGQTRHDSVGRGIDLVRRMDLVPAFVAVHDAARPMVKQELIDRVFDTALQFGAAVPGVAVTDTIKRRRDGVVVETLPRAELVAVQTPQAMRLDWYVEALERAPAGATDDASVLEAAGYPVRVVAGDTGNVKVTTRSDLFHVERAGE